MKNGTLSIIVVTILMAFVSSSRIEATSCTKSCECIRHNSNGTLNFSHVCRPYGTGKACEDQTCSPYSALSNRGCPMDSMCSYDTQRRGYYCRAMGTMCSITPPVCSGCTILSCGSSYCQIQCSDGIHTIWPGGVIGY